MAGEAWREWPVNWGKTEPRPYQIEAALEVLEHGNSLVVMPTALGKTFIAYLVFAGILARNPSARALVLTPTKPLAVQQAQRAREVLKLAGTVAVLTGEVPPEKRSEPWKAAQVVVATPQTVVSDVLVGKGNLGDFAFLVVDECHRAVGEYAYAFIGKQTRAHPNLLVLGLTASPSSEREKIDEVRGNLGAVHVVIRNESDDDVREFARPLKIEWEFVNLPPAFKELRIGLEGILRESLHSLKLKGFLESSDVRVDKKTLLAARTRILAAAHGGERSAYTALSEQAKALNLLHAIDLLESQGIVSLHKFLESLSERKLASKAVQSLAQDFRIAKLRNECSRAIAAGVEHPKFALLRDLVGEEARAGRSLIVFAQFRHTITEIQRELNFVPGVSARVLVGRSEGGMSQKQQANAVQEFRERKFNVLVASSVGEEGLDIPAVDVVVFFEAVPSEIRSIQRRGRAGRVRAGRTMMLVARGTKDEAFFWIAKRKEREMKEALSELREELLEDGEKSVAPDDKKGRQTTL